MTSEPNVTRYPRLVLAGLSGGSGKTIVSLGLARAWADAGLRVKPFKKGPDYIDAAWLGLAARQECTNLDPGLLDRASLLTLFQEKACASDLALVEGNRGLFDGKDVRGSCSTAELARILRAPVALVVDCTKMTRTIAAVVQGCAGFEPDVPLAGVILNRTAGQRHRTMLRRAVETYTDVAVLGTLPKLAENPIPERHMGLWSGEELSDGGNQSLQALGKTMAENLDLERLLEEARCAPALDEQRAEIWPRAEAGPQPTIGYVRDAAFWFYYPENLEALERAGARLVKLSLLDNEPWPELHGLYLGGGFPETLAEQLAGNRSRRDQVRELALSGLPIYAECGGFMYLCQQLEFDGKDWPMAGVFPLRTGFCQRPQGLGYTEAEVLRDTPFYRAGEIVHGHEFHYSRCVVPGQDGIPEMTMRMRRGKGMLDQKDGAFFAATQAGYNHIFALATPQWAPNFVRAARARLLQTSGDC
ncbi:cobyrinic acid a,c-diamide synthase [Paucidesulfovibrio gracilis DSM 16080]|uniref:Cobyrinate a,c-diamide synthase n=1 Tax=Paucidesulfovibrio gracilis DSM 16080 TaxID=1121449 RepID=A0A1T4WY99_9BACT|nr:cobyrinate a,c-diamide synthase [Paucidesulfovibrio gracilis]SKA82363.1 cobyrinic acid a,c-diamide synthase [Paucidesulfovibrio gracilis DSM 16080]